MLSCLNPAVLESGMWSHCWRCSYLCIVLLCLLYDTEMKFELRSQEYNYNCSIYAATIASWNCYKYDLLVYNDHCYYCEVSSRIRIAEREQHKYESNSTVLWFPNHCCFEMYLYKHTLLNIHYT